MNKLANKVAVITGGSCGIGLATARLFLEEGARVVVTARGAEGLAEAQRVLGPKAHVIPCDVTRPDDLTRLFQETEKKLDKVDVVFANAAVVKLASIADSSDDVFSTRKRHRHKRSSQGCSSFGFSQRKGVRPG